MTYTRVRNRIERGSGIYACRSCKRKTRATGNGDNEMVRMCVQCYELAGIDNAYSDGCAEPGYLETARYYFNACVAKGGQITHADFGNIPFTSEE